MKKIQFVVIGLIAMLLVQNATAVDISSIFSEILSLKFRTDVFREYYRLSTELLTLLENFDMLILENPSFVEEKKVGIVNTSITETKILAIKEAAYGFVDISLSKEKPIALVSFKDEAVIDSLPSKDKNFLHKKISLYKPSGFSCVHCGILKAIEALSVVDERKDMVLITDGHTSSSKNLALQAANFARAKGIRIYTIALGDDADENFLLEISSITRGKFYKITCDKKLSEIYREISSEAGVIALALDTSNSMLGSLSIECLESRELCNIRCIINAIISILTPLYVTLTLVVGIYLLFFSGSPEARVRAKSSLLFLIISMCLITVSPLLLTLFFGISHGITQIILAQIPIEKEKIFFESITYLLSNAEEYAKLEEIPTMPFLVYTYFAIFILILILKLRYFILLTLATLFPFAILLYPLKLTRGISKLLFEQTVLWTLSQIAMAFVFSISMVGIKMISGMQTFVAPFELRIIMEISSLLMLAITPIFISIKFRNFLGR